jgi:hypothetical protein
MTYNLYMIECENRKIQVNSVKTFLPKIKIAKGEVGVIMQTILFNNCLKILFHKHLKLLLWSGEDLENIISL